MQYTEMVFYSSDPTSNLHRELADNQVSGVYVESRESIDEALMRIADRIIGKVVDLTHMRGIAMAEVAELDLVMAETLSEAFRSARPEIEQRKARTIRKLKERATQQAADASRITEDCVADAVRDSHLFSSTQKFRAIKRLARCLPQQRPEFNQPTDYEQEIIRNRNILAHAKEATTPHGATILRSVDGSQNITIDDGWMQEFRKKMKLHGDVLRQVCCELRDYVRED